MSKNVNSWQATMYDSDLAKASIGSARFNELAIKEANFIIKQLKLVEGSKLLDVPCGTGRHSAVFSEAGIDVTGLDINPNLLKIAKRYAKDATFELADMSNLKRYRHRFDVAVNLFSSFGYFENDAANKKVLKEIYSTLNPGGTFVLHLIDRDWLMTVYQPSGWRQEGDELIIEARKFDSKSNYNEEQKVIVNQRSGKARTFYHRMRLYNKNEMVALLKEVGFKHVKVFGDNDGGKFKRRLTTHPFYFASR